MPSPPTPPPPWGRPKLVTLSDGTLVVAYAVEVEGGFEIRGRSFDALGNALGEEYTFGFSRTIDEPDFDITATNDNHVAIVVEIDDGNFQINTRTFEVGPSSAQFSGGGSFFADEGAEVLNPTITASRSGDFNDHRFAFIDDNPGDSELELAGLDDGSSVRGTAVNVDADTRAELDSATLENGNTVVILDEFGDAGSVMKIFTYGPNDNLLRQVNISAGTSSREPTVAALTGGGFVVAFTKSVNNSQDTVFALFNADGTLRQGPTDFGEDASIGLLFNEPAIVALDDGGFIIFYDQDGIFGPEVRGQRFDADGNEVGEDFQVAARDGSDLSATLLENGLIAVSYGR